MVTKTNSRMIEGVSRVTSISEFSPVGDGIADDTAAVKSLLLSGGKLLELEAGKTYLVTEKLSCPTNSVEFNGNGAVITGAITDDTLIEFSGDNVEITNTIFDGKNGTSYGVDLSGESPIFDGNTVRNFSSDSTGVQAVIVRAKLAGRVSNNYIHNTYSKPNSSIGDSVGASRAIYVDVRNSDRTEPLIIENNIINDILGEEGDAIHVQGTDTTPYRRARTIIRNNVISRCTRRAIKLQSSNNEVYGNTYTHWLSLADSVNFNTCVASIGGTDNVIRDNVLDGTYGNGINLEGLSGTRATGLEVSGNYISTGYYSSGDSGWNKSSQRCIYMSWTRSAVIKGNVVVAGVNAIETSESHGAVIVDNTVLEKNGSKDSGSGVYVNSSSPFAKISGNTGYDGTYKRVYFIRAHGSDPIVTNNHTRYPSHTTSNQGVVNLAATAERAYVSGNTSDCDTFGAVTGSTPTSAYVFANVNQGLFETNNLAVRVVGVPSAADAAGRKGDVAFTSTYIYTCIATNTWVRSPAATW